MTTPDDYSRHEALHTVTSVQVAGPGRLLLWFGDGSKAVVDLSIMLAPGSVFEPLRDIDWFKAVEIGPRGRTILWRLPGGVVDVCADALWRLATTKLDRFQQLFHDRIVAASARIGEEDGVA